MKPHPILYPLSLLYGVVVNVRNFLFDAKILPAEKIGIPVISVGNITAGGTGKTPIVEMIARELIEAGKKVAVVSRGYKRGSSGLAIVSDGRTLRVTVEEAGDEAFMLAKRLPKAIVIVDEERARGARCAQKELNAEVVVLDDGFQHRYLHRDVDIVLIDAMCTPFSTPLLPAGYRREPLRSLRRATMVVLTKRKNPTDVRELKEKIKEYSAVTLFSSSYVAIEIIRLQEHQSYPVEWIRGRNVTAFCAIGRPESFRSSLEETGATVRSFIAFPDHHRFSDDDIRTIQERFGDDGSDCIITTEKDAVRCAASFGTRMPLYILRMKAAIEEREDWISRIEQIFH